MAQTVLLFICLGATISSAQGLHLALCWRGWDGGCGVGGLNLG